MKKILNFFGSEKTTNLIDSIILYYLIVIILFVSAIAIIY